MSDESRIDSILGDWRARRDAGEILSPDVVVAAHPDLAASLRARFGALAAVAAARRPSLRDVPSERYADFRVLGEGGMGIVYWALDTDLNREVAFKVVRPDAGRSDVATPAAPIGLAPPPADTPASTAFAALKARFLQEAWVTAGLEHPGIVPVYEVGQTPEGVPYYTMRFVRGSRTFAAAIDGVRGRPVDARLALLEPFLKVCDTIRYAHAHGVIHRDLKPENVALGEFGEVVVLDWGLAKMTGRPDEFAETWQHRLQEYRDAADLKTMASALGTPGYMAPEAALGRTHEVDARSDVYSLGAMLFEILVGRLPYEFRTYGELVTKLMREDAPRAETLDPAVPAEVAAICARALTRDRTQRTTSADALAEELREWLRRRERDAQIHALLAEAETTREGLETETGDALLRRVDRLQGLAARILAIDGAHARAAAISSEADALQERAIGEREHAARGRALRRAAVVGLAAALVGAAAFAVVVRAEREDLRNAQGRLRSAGLVAASSAAAARDPILALRLADEAVRAVPTDAAVARLQAALQDCPACCVVAGGVVGCRYVTFDPPGANVAIAADGGTLVVPVQGGKGTVLPSDAGSSVFWVAYSPDGRRIVTDSAQSVDLWTSEGMHLAKLGQAATPQPYFAPAAFAPKGDRIVGTGNSSVTAWDLDGRNAVTLGGTDGSCVVASARGNRIVALGHTVSAWDGDLRPAGTHRADRYAWDAAFSPAGDRMVAYYGKSAWIQTPDGRTLVELPEAAEDVAAVGWSAAGVVSVLQGARLRLFDGDGRLRAETPASETETAAVFSPDGERIATGASDGTVRVRSADGDLVSMLRGHQRPIVSVSFAPGGNRIASADSDGVVIVWRLPALRPTKIPGSSSAVAQADVLPRGRGIVTLSADGVACVRDLDGKVCVPLRGHDGPVLCLATSADGETIVTGGRDGTARTWDRNGAPCAVLRGHGGPVVAVASIAGGRTVTGSTDRTVRIWGREGTQPTTCAAVAYDRSLDELPVTALAVSPAGDRILAIVDDGLRRATKMWDAEGRLLHATGWAEARSSPAFSADGSVCGVGTSEWKAYVTDHDGAKGAAVPGGAAGRADVTAASRQHIAFSPAGDRVVMSTADGALCVDLRTWSTVTYGLHRGPIRRVAFSPSGDRVVALGDDGIAELYTAAGDRLLVLGEPGAAARCVTFSPEGDAVVTGCDDGSVRVWSTSAAEVLRAAQDRRLPAWTDAERARLADLFPPASVDAAATR